MDENPYRAPREPGAMPAKRIGPTWRLFVWVGVVVAVTAPVGLYGRDKGLLPLAVTFAGLLLYVVLTFKSQTRHSR
jgi:hypothetical protein